MREGSGYMFINAYLEGASPKKLFLVKLDTYLTTYSLWSAMHELSLLLSYQVYR